MNYYIFYAILETNWFILRKKAHHEFTTVWKEITSRNQPIYWRTKGIPFLEDPPALFQDQEV